MGLALLSLSSFAGTRVLYQQNFETAGSVADTGWDVHADITASIASDEFGKFLELSLGQHNGRSAFVQWGEAVFMNEDGNVVLEDGTYTISYDFSIKANSTNQYNTDLTIFTGAAGIANQPFRGRWSGDIGPWNNFIADMYQANTAADADMLVAVNAPYKTTTTAADDGTESTSYPVDLSETYNLATGNWYTFTSVVDVNSRVVEYSIVDVSGNVLTEGEMTVPESSMDAENTPVSMYAAGLWVMMARYQTIICLDNFKISYESEFDVANDPTVALTGVGVVQDESGEDVVNLNARTYTVSFIDGETLHVQAPGLEEAVVEWADCDGSYNFTVTESGTIKAWTVCGDATSAIVETEAECAPVVLPAATATISAVEVGYGKTYTLGVNNADTPLSPTIFINYEYVLEDGSIESSEEGVATGAKVTVSGKGTLKLTTEAFGYQATDVEIENNLEFELKNDYDFARMTKDELTAAGFASWNVLNSGSTSGFNNWTARKRLFYYDAASATKDEETGETVYTTVYPFGFIAEDNTTNVIEYSEIMTDANPAGTELFKGIGLYTGHNVCAMLHIGIYNNETSGGNNKNVDVFNLDPTDFVVINRINNYGGNSCHPTVETVEEYYAQLAGDNEVYSVAASGVQGDNGLYTVSMPVYRIDTAATRVTVYGQKGAPSAVEGIEAAPVVNGDGKWYNLQGIQVAEPNASGIYIHNGKKVLIRK